MAEFKMVCPGCGTLYSSGSTESRPCLKCGASVVYTGFTKEEFDRKSDSEKQIIIDNVKSGRIQPAPKAVASGSFWIGFVDTITNILIVIGILASLIVGIVVMSNGSGGLGFLIIVLGIFVTLLTVAMTKLLIGAAKDLSYIRKYLEHKDK